MVSITMYGFYEILLKFQSAKGVPQGVDIDQLGSLDVEGVTILRPLKGIDPEIELCLESALLQRYPRFEVLFCVESVDDPVVPIVRALLERHPAVQARLLIDEDYETNHSGPNPKINNLTKGFKQAKHDIVWVLDSNVVVNPGTLLRSVHSLNNSIDNGRPTSRPVKIVHHVPLAVAINSTVGAQLDEMFLHTSHAKFYVFFNKSSFAPCVNGKSNLYRISDLDLAVECIARGENKIINNSLHIALEAKKFVGKRGEGIRFFARYIGEDNMIGIALWGMGRTAMTGDVVIQPIGGSSIADYIKRRVRWLRVRKYMVLAATLVEPTSESLVVGWFGSYGISNIWLGGHHKLLLLLIHEVLWCLVDYTQFHALRTYANQDELSTRPVSLRSFPDSDYHWLLIWCLREVLALPIWVIAMCGSQIDWRNRPFRINADLSAKEL